MRTSCEGILYPKDALGILRSSFKASDTKPHPCVVELPHASWQVCKAELDKAFSSLDTKGYDHIFVLAPLHKGKIGYDDAFTLYTPQTDALSGSDWQVPLAVPASLKEFFTQSDDVCSEEHSLEVIAPYLALLFANVPVTYALAPQQDGKLASFVKILGRDFPNALIFISNNRGTDCAYMWKEAIAP